MTEPVTIQYTAIQSNSVMVQYDYGSVCHPYRRPNPAVESRWRLIIEDWSASGGRGEQVRADEASALTRRGAVHQSIRRLKISRTRRNSVLTPEKKASRGGRRGVLQPFPPGVLGTVRSRRFPPEAAEALTHRRVQNQTNLNTGVRTKPVS